eukprot:TRINITY_DN1793_c0_g1_i1.p1 TRINITY_DN1793_c0_g1~~TRINITY_DN1793_c0_g1_i1.p1  ORF type:complete len:327 (-),score=90.80 TRINITY_DN1793_c0_g1_i1:179-1159(-)
MSPVSTILALSVVGVASFALARPVLNDYAVRYALANHQDEVAAGVLNWWAALCAVACVNVCAWCLFAPAVLRAPSHSATRSRTAAGASSPGARRAVMWLAGIYVLGCAFRSVLPRADVQRLCLFDHELSTVAVGRSVATVAELAFVAQWALLLHEFSSAASLAWGRFVALLLVPLITIAEVFSWGSVLSLKYLNNAIEESLWAVSAFLAVICTARLWTLCAGRLRPYLALAIVGGLVYILFMCLVDVPMYVGRYLVDEAAGKSYLTLWEGVHDVATRRFISYAWSEWATEIPWMSLYFSFAVWWSISLAFAPRFELAAASVSKKRS